MVARRADAARTTTDKMRENSDRIDDLARASGRPTTSLRNDIGHAVELTSQSSRPMMIPSAVDASDSSSNTTIDSALLFRNGGLEVRDPTDTANRDFVARTINATGSIGTKQNLVAQGDVNVAGNAFSANSTCFGNSSADRYHATDRVDADGYVYAGLDINAGRSIGAALNVIDSLGNVRNGASMPDRKTDVQPIAAADALAALAKLNYYTFRYIDDASGERFAGPMLPEIADDTLLATTVRNGEDGDPESFNIQSMVGLIAAALPAIQSNLNDTYGSLAPLQTVAKSLPGIVSHSDDVHDALTQGQAAIGQAVASIQQSAQNLASSLTSITQLAAQAQASAAIASATATAAGQRCASLEARSASLETKVADHEARIAALEARKVRSFRAAGNLPTLALGGTSDVTCAWTSTVPSPLPTLDQVQVFVAGSATPTVKSVSASSVVVTVKATLAVLPAPGAVQVLATTY